MERPQINESVAAGAAEREEDSMLRLASSTPVEWVKRMEANLGDFLLDHAHCEKKAASTALSLIFRYPEFTCLIRPLTEVAREELEHFELL